MSTRPSTTVVDTFTKLDIDSPASAAVMALFGPAGLFLFTAFVAAAAGGFTFWRMRQRPELPTDERQPFLSVPRTTPAAAELDPRGPDFEPEIAENKG